MAVKNTVDYHTHRDNNMHIERLALFNSIIGLLDFLCSYKIILCVHLKHSSFWISADAKPMSNDLVHELHVCSLSLSLFILTMLCLGQTP
jgi:hypothetical protein